MHKKDKHYNKNSTASIGSQKGPAAAAAGAAAMQKAMMSGDSPDTHVRGDPLLELKERTGVSNSSTRPSGETVTASVLVEPQPKPHEAIACPPTDNTSSKPPRPRSTDEELIETAETPLTTRKASGDDSDNHRAKENGGVDKTDSAINTNNIYGKKIPQGEEEEDGCMVKCLYFTMQCCECAIM